MQWRIILLRWPCTWCLKIRDCRVTSQVISMAKDWVPQSSRRLPLHCTIFRIGFSHDLPLLHVNFAFQFHVKTFQWISKWKCAPAHHLEASLTGGSDSNIRGSPVRSVIRRVGAMWRDWSERKYVKWEVICAHLFIWKRLRCFRNKGMQFLESDPIRRAAR